MSKQTSSATSNFLGLLTLLFIALKLTGYIDWSWWWVLAPLWAGFAIVLTVLLLLVFYFFCKDQCKKVATWYRTGGYNR